LADPSLRGSANLADHSASSSRPSSSWRSISRPPRRAGWRFPSRCWGGRMKWFSSARPGSFPPGALVRLVAFG